MTEQVERLAAVFGGGAQAAFIAVLIVALAALFVFYVRAKNDHIKTCLTIIPPGEKLAAEIGGFRDDVQRLAGIVDMAVKRQDDRLDKTEQVMRETNVTLRAYMRGSGIWQKTGTPPK